MEVRAGYKQTEVGLVPEEWKVIPMGQLGTLTMGKGLLKDDIRVSGLIPAIPYTAIYTDFAEILDYKEIKWFVNDEKSTHIASEPCVLIASSSNMEANTGKATALPESRRVAIGREVIAYRTSCDARYVSYLLSTAAYRRKTLSVARGTTIKHVYPATFVDYQIAVPSAIEQSAIATTLSDVDALLAKIDQLIAKKRDLKQAAMQQLLTGQTRLPEFSGKWEVKRLGDQLIRLRKTNRPSAVGRAEGQYLFFTNSTRPCDKYLDEFDFDCEAIVANTGGTAYFNYVNGQFAAMADCYVFESRLVTHFLYFSLKLLEQRINETCFTGSGIKHLDKTYFASIELRVPPTSTEQTAIASVLSDMDAELAVLEARRDKTRSLKQGMMQALLTGRIRLV